LAAIVFFGSPAVAVRYDSWREWRDDVARPLPPAPLIASRTASCPRCWGQGRHFEQARNGEGLVPVGCPGCGGSGLVVVDPDAGPRPGITASGGR
jgi:hypothetical protein